MPDDTLRDTAVVIVHWGKPERARVALASLRAAYPEPHAPTVYLVENGPPPTVIAGTPAETVRLLENRGYGAGGNAGLRAAFAHGAAFAVLLNNDVQVPPGLLEQTRAAATAEGIGLVGVTCVEPTGTVYGGGSISWGTLEARLATAPVPADDLQYLHGACLGITRSCFERVGPLREDFFLYWEDADYGLRARRAGFRFAVVSHPSVFHEASSTSGQGVDAKTYYLVRNAHHFVALHGSLPARLWARTLLPLRCRVARARGKHVVLRALHDARRGVWGPAPQ